jgi:hypothetical protein
MAETTKNSEVMMCREIVNVKCAKPHDVIKFDEDMTVGSFIEASKPVKMSWTSICDPSIIDWIDYERLKSDEDVCMSEYSMSNGPRRQ